MSEPQPPGPAATPEVRARLDAFVAAPMRGEPGYECPHHPPSQRCVSCITDEEWEEETADE